MSPHHAPFFRAINAEILAGLTLGVKCASVPGISTGSAGVCSQTERTVKPRSKAEGALLVGRWG